MNLNPLFIWYRIVSEGPQDIENISNLRYSVVTVTYDGTWQKSGNSSHKGVGAVAKVDIGLVLDFQVITNYCKDCQNGPKIQLSYTWCLAAEPWLEVSEKLWWFIQSYGRWGSHAYFCPVSQDEKASLRSDALWWRLQGRCRDKSIFLLRHSDC